MPPVPDDAPDGDPAAAASPAPLGPYAYLHWREMADAPAGVPPKVTELALFTDARLVGEPPPFGAYRLLNTVAHVGGYAAAYRGVPSLYLRVSSHEREYQSPDWSATRAEHYHGGTLVDEIAALLSLECGMRVAASDVPSREFTPGGDPHGRPYHFESFRRTPQVQDPGPGPIVPALTGERNIAVLPHVARLPELRLADATALVKAARLYQTAALLAETAPELAWLLFVSAVETAAVHAVGESTDVERLEAWRPELTRLLREACGEAVLARAAAIVAPVTGATGKFVSFLQRFAPSPPEPRPPASLRADLGSRAKRARVYSVIYEYRSAALHAGRPFPGPMCQRPHPADGSYAERPVGLAAAYGTAVWRGEDIPIMLNTFAVLVRLALLHWWASLLPDAGTTGAAPQE